ncbi:VanZ family protein [Sporomusa sp.]|uniref:VanZ family protein n=1 Tax=Sporomusa sp. TaxID=2078658 RepID=UPI002CCA352A|nr:VanZ family protein [Sporomusa sp.]HWR45820.1 VanZ family protein [Sporomusa sp.]
MVKIRYWYLVVGLMVAISVLSNIPNLVFFGKVVPPEFRVWIMKHSIKWGTTGFFSYSISPHPDYILHKLGHIFLFGFLGIALYWAMNRSVPKAVMVITLFALIDEIHQGFTLGRSSRFGDVVLDVIAAVGFILLFSKRRVKTGEPN